MRRILLFTILGLASCSLFSQVMVNGVDLNNEVDMFELWAFKKPFNHKESLYVNYGQDKFRPHYYDHKTQRVYNSDGKYYQKGEYMALYKYLKSQGWEKVDDRYASFGDAEGRVITFEKIEEDG